MFTKRGTLLLGVALLLAIVIAIAVVCSRGDDSPADAPPSTDVPAATATPQTTDLTIDDLRNATYISSNAESGTVTLIDGHFEGSSVSEGVDFPLFVWLGDETGFGDLDGDGVDDAAVTLGTDTGGTGRFVELVAVLNEDSTPAPVASISLGDRVIVEAIRIAESRIELDMVTHGPNDGLCCPSLPVLRIFALEESQLVLIEELPR